MSSADSGTLDADAWMARWEAAASGRRSGPVLPPDEARLVVEAVLDALGGGDAGNLERAARSWGRAHWSVVELVERLAVLRQVLGSVCGEELSMHRALDRITAVAIGEVLRRLEEASRTDALTGVGNRRASEEFLQSSLSAAARQGNAVSVVMIDLDGLKRINDTRGHQSGDTALQALVSALLSTVGEEDGVFRVGGDEFVVVLPFTEVEELPSLMSRVVGAGAPPFTWGSSARPGDGSEPGTLLVAADRDLYERRHALRRVSPRDHHATTLPRSRGIVRWAWAPAAWVLAATVAITVLTAGHGHRAPTELSAAPPPTAPFGVVGGPLPPPASGRFSGPFGDHAGGVVPLAIAAAGPGAVTVISDVAMTSQVPTPPAPPPAPTPPTPPAPRPPLLPPGGTLPAPPVTWAGGLVQVVGNVVAPVPLVGGTLSQVADVAARFVDGIGLGLAAPAVAAASPAVGVSASPAAVG